MSDPNKISIWVIQFNRKKEEYRSWSKKFMAAAVVKKIKPTLIETIEVPTHDEPLNIKMDKKKKAARIMNEWAYNELILAIQGEVAFEIVEDSATNELPDGDAHLT